MPRNDHRVVQASEAKVSSGKLATAVDVLERAIEKGVMPGAVVCASRAGRIFLHRAMGTLDDSAGHPVKLDTIYDLASITKPMATAASALVLAEQGKLSLAAGIGSLLPDVPQQLSSATVQQLLTHISGLPAHANCFESGTGFEAASRAIFAQPLAAGSRYEYSCLGFILLGRIVEQISQMPLNEFARKAVFDPLDLSADVQFKPDATFFHRIAVTKSRESALPGETSENMLLGIVNDGNCRAIGGVAGNAGLFGTAADVLAFGDAILNQRPGLFGAPTRERILVNQINPTVGAHTLMFFAQGNGYCPSGDLLSPQTVGHSGFTGCVLTLDPKYQLVVVVLSNRVYSSGDAAPWLSARRHFLNALAGALD
jgi:CubicO group peptidase (beta-lactamase class C family)